MVTRKAKDVRNQAHYTQFVIQPIEFIMKNKLDYATGNVIKYVCRQKMKNGIEDLEKAKHYIDYLIKEASEVSKNNLKIVVKSKK